jgi:hypothetical protein
MANNTQVLATTKKIFRVDFYYGTTHIRTSYAKGYRIGDVSLFALGQLDTYGGNWFDVVEVDDSLVPIKPIMFS